MQVTKLEMSLHINNVLTEQGADHKVIALLAECDLQPDKFYLTGFETISFNRDKWFVLETVLASVTSFDTDVLVINTGVQSTRIIDICKSHKLNCSIADYHLIGGDLSLLADILENHPSITHLVLSEGDTLSISREELRQIGKLAGKYKVDLIVDCHDAPLSVRTALDCGVSFMVSCGGSHSGQAIVIARRAKLVQAEGRSRSVMYDLYGYWQKTLVFRNHEIEPMAV
jgi:aspartate aminotransferase-like enzyme